MTAKKLSISRTLLRVCLVLASLAPTSCKTSANSGTRVLADGALADIPAPECGGSSSQFLDTAPLSMIYHFVVKGDGPFETTRKEVQANAEAQVRSCVSQSEAYKSCMTRGGVPAFNTTIACDLDTTSNTAAGGVHGDPIGGDDGSSGTRVACKGGVSDFKCNADQLRQCWDFGNAADFKKACNGGFIDEGSVTTCTAHGAHRLSVGGADAPSIEACARQCRLGAAAKCMERDGYPASQIKPYQR